MRFSKVSMTPMRWAALVAVVAYVLGFDELYQLLGPHAAVLAIIPISLLAWGWGAAVGLVSGVGAVLATIVLINLVPGAERGWLVMFQNGRDVGSLALVAAGTLVGYLRDGQVRAAREVARRVESESRLAERETLYRAHFDESPLPLVVEDFSAVRRRLEELRTAGVTEWGAYFAEHPEVVEVCAHDVVILDANRPAVRLFHARHKGELTQNIASLILHGDYAGFTHELTAIAQGQTAFQNDGSGRTVDGHCLHLDMHWAAVRGYENTLARVVVSFMDITARHEAEQALQASEARWRAVTEMAPDAIVASDHQGEIIVFNRSAERLFGRSAAEVLGQPVTRLVPADTREQHLAAVRRRRSGGLPRPSWAAYETRALRKDGGLVPVEITVADWETPEGLCYSAIIRDLSERKRAEEALGRDAMHDDLTGLPNRRLFLDRLGQAQQRGRRNGTIYAVLCLDLDQFRAVNESLGPAQADELLVAAAQRLVACVRTVDTVARLNGDEFAILLDDPRDQDGALQVVLRIQSAVAGRFTLGTGQTIALTASLGIVLASAAPEAPAEILRDADTAMYHAKHQGRNRYVMFDPGMRVTLLSQQSLEADLRAALERGEFLTHYQPIVSLTTGATLGYEALLRWQHPERGLVAAATFMPVAESTGLIVPIGQWLLRQAARQIMDWQAERGADPPLILSINVSSRQFHLPNLDEQLRQALAETGLPPSRLRLEIAERTILEDIEATASALTRLRALGVELQIDNFGTGYSALNYLQRLELDAIKIDKSFIRRLGADVNHSAVVRMIMALGTSLGLRVIAEGVETEGQLDLLRELGCDVAQGYLLGRPAAGQSGAAPETLAVLHPPEAAPVVAPDKYT